MKRKTIKFLKKLIRYPLEIVILAPIVAILYLLRVELASKIMGKIAFIIGSKLPVNLVAEKNLKLCMPHLTNEQRQEIIKSMWCNLGGIIGEMFHWYRMDWHEIEDRIELVDLSNGDFFKEQPSLVLSAHYGNWEVLPWFLKFHKIRFSMLYRYANNPVVNKLLCLLRQKSGGEMIEKGVGGLKKVLKALQSKKHVGMLVDQKTNSGIMVPFFSIDAPTTAAPANLAIKSSCPIFMIRATRKKGVKYSVEISKPLKISKGEKVEDVMAEVNKIIEGWVLEEPSQWFWVHKRWGKSFYKREVE